MATIIIVAIVAVVLLLAMVVGLAASLGRQHISEDYFLAGQSLPWYVVACSVATLALRLEMWLGLLGLAYTVGLAAGGFGWAAFIGLTVLSAVLLPYLIRKKIYSPAEFLERRFSPATRGLFALLAILYLVAGVLVPALFIGGRVVMEAGFSLPLEPIEGIPWLFFACVAGIAILASLAGVAGGSRAGAWAGLVQFLAIVIGGTVFAVMAVRDVGGLPAVLESNGPGRTLLLMSPRHEQLPWFGMAAIALTIALWNSAASPLVVQRCLGARSEWDARLGAIVGAILLLALPVVFVLPGLAANLKLGTPGNTGLAGERSALQLIAVLFERTNPLAAAGQGLVVAAVLAAVTNSVSAAVHAVSTLWTMDISQGMLQRNDSESELVARGRMSSIVTIVLAALLTPLLLLWNGGVFDYVLELTAILAPPAAVVFLVSFFWSQVHARSAVATLVCGCIVGAALWLLVTQAQAEAVPQWLGPVCTRAGVTGLASLVLLGLFSLAIPASAQEYYDPGASWSLDLVRLPPHERDAGSGLGSLLLWWGMMFIASVALWVVLR